jgi:D-glycero-D-manno-heptose 1,7-bisphosphate phosphatase
MNRRAAFLDRDGVLVETFVRGERAFAPVSLDEFQITEGAGRLVQQLRQAGLLPVVFTNQPDVGRGIITPEVLAEMHARLRAAVPVHDVLVCIHDDGSGCACRKPKPGMLLAAAARWGIDLQSSFVIGDRWQDIEAGRAAGCYTILIARPYSGRAEPDAAVPNLTAAVKVVLERLGDEA